MTGLLDGGENGTGHAGIIKWGYTDIGCFWMGSDFYGGMWTCDFAGGPGDVGWWGGGEGRDRLGG